MPRPRPKELVVSWASEMTRTIFITVGSEDARAWLVREGGAVGRVVNSVGNQYYVFVEATYDFEEVVAWLKSYNDSTNDST